MSEIPSISPFKLLQAYEKEDIRHYFGREKEIRQLYDALRRSKFLMVYGASGTGKTSLLQCGLQNMYSFRDWMPVFVRRGDNFPDSIREELTARYRAYFAGQPVLEEGGGGASLPDPESLHSLRDLIKALFSVTYVPVYIILDQFEEIFTLGDRAEQDAFFTELKELELFSEDLFCKLVIVTREEYIAHFYRYEKQFPPLFEYRFRVEKMRHEQLLDVVSGTLTTPYPGYPEIQLETGAATGILDTLSDEKGDVDLTTLQVYLDRLYQEDRIRAGQRPDILVDNSLVRQNQLDDVLSDFLDRQLERISGILAKNFGAEMTENPRAAIRILFQMVTAQGTKQTRSAEDIHRDLQLTRGSVSLELVMRCLEEFAGQESRVLNRVQYAKTGTERFEITHDRLAECIFSKFNSEEIRRREAVTTISQKIKRFREADAAGIQAREYLSIGEIELIDQALDVARLDADLGAFFAESRLFHAHQARLKRRRFRFAIASACVFALMAAAAFILFFRADAAEKKAVYQAKVARASQLASMAEKELAEHKRHEALLIAAEGYSILPDAPPDIVFQTIGKVFYSGFEKHMPLLKAVMNDHRGWVLYARFSPDGARMVSASTDSTANLWDLNGRLLASLRHKGEVLSASFSPDGSRILTISTDSTAGIWDLNGNLLASLNGYPRPLASAVFSPDGQLVLTSYKDNAVKLWNVNGELIADLKGHNGPASALAFAPDGKKVLTASEDHTARLWDLTGNQLAVFKHNGSVLHARFSPDGASVLTGSEDHTAVLWDLNGRELKRLEGHREAIRYVDFSPDGQYLLTASYDGTVRLWRPDGSFQQEYRHRDGVRMAAFSPDGRTILSASRDRTAKIWDLQGNLLADLARHGHWLNWGAFSPDGAKLVTASLDSTLMLWDLAGELLGDITAHKAEIIQGAFSPDGRRIVTASLDGKAVIADLQGNPVAVLDHQHSGVYSAVFSHAGDHVLTASMDGAARIWSSNGLFEATLTGHEGPVISGVFSPDDRTVLTASMDHTARLWDRNGRMIAAFTGHEQRLTSAVFSPDGTAILTASEDNKAILWDTSGNRLREFVHDDWVMGALFSPAGKNILTFSRDKTAKLWAPDGTLVTHFNGHERTIKAAAFSPDGQQILTASDDKKAILWDLAGRQLAVFQHEDYVLSAVFSPDGNRILTASADHTAKLWNRNGKLLINFPYHTDRVNKAVFSPDGENILTVSADGTAKIWPMPGRIYRWLTQQPIVPLSVSERERLGGG